MKTAITSNRKMKLLSVNVSQPKEVPYNGTIIATSIFKESVRGRIMLRTLNLAGDAQADLSVHGGVDKAVYVYSTENYDYWRRALNRDDLPYGQFGENFTVEGMPDDKIHIGDVFRIGNALVEVTQPRVPCYKLGIKMGDPRFLKRFLVAERSGFYFRVLEEGEVDAGDIIYREKLGPEQMTVREIHHLLFFDTNNVEIAKRALLIPALSPSWRDSFENIVAKASKTSLENADCCSGA